MMNEIIKVVRQVSQLNNKCLVKMQPDERLIFFNFFVNIC